MTRTFAQYCRESGYRGDLDGLLGRVEAPGEFLRSLPENVLHQADTSAFRECFGGAGGPVITLGQIAQAWGKSVREVARLAGKTEFLGEQL